MADQTKQNRNKPQKTQKIPLDYSAHADGVEIKVLYMRRPKVRDMLGVEKTAENDAEKEIHLFANLCEVSPECIQDLDMSDYGKVQKEYQDFLS